MMLSDLATVIRSKNAGPFELTFDVLFANQDDYQQVVSSKQLSAESFAELYARLIWLMYCRSLSSNPRSPLRSRLSARDPRVRLAKPMCMEPNSMRPFYKSRFFNFLRV
jgi:hypothetical protein